MELVSGESVNNATPKVVNSRSTFDLSYPLAGTYRFGEYAPNFVMECVPNDKNVRLQSIHEARSTSLEAPLLADIMLKKDYFRVNMEAILPMNWDKLYTNPIIGDDVDALMVGANLKDILHKLSTISNLTYQFVTRSTSNSDIFLSAVAYLVFFEKFFSKGSLLASLDINLSQFYLAYESSQSQLFDIQHTFDYFEDKVLSMLKEAIFSVDDYFVAVDNYDNYYAVFASTLPASISNSGNYNYQPIDFNRFLSIFRDDGIKSALFVSSLDFSDVQAFFANYLIINAPSEPLNINISRVWAYQLACAHFYTDDHIDFVYSAQLYRDLIKSYYDVAMWNTGDPFPDDSFQLNGLNYHYDSLSCFYIDIMLKALAGQYTSLAGNTYTPVLKDFLEIYIPYFNSIFSFRNSLRYKDYFTGSHSLPLAVGDVDVAVHQGKVSVIDTIQRTQVSRFLNAVNRGRRQIREYIENLFPGLSVSPSPTDPSWLGHTTDVIYDNEVENTAEAQQTKAVSVTSTLRSNASRYAFEVDIDRPCVLIGIMYFDIERYYGYSIERPNLHINRFDMFNPFMQFIGDQAVFQIEKGLPDSSYNPDDPFAYQLRHAEYKQRYAQYFGGFSESLPGWLFVNMDVTTPHISPSYIRSYPSELDRYFLSLSGLSLESYFHFIIKNVNKVSASRPMVYAPSLL